MVVSQGDRAVSILNVQSKAIVFFFPSFFFFFFAPPGFEEREKKEGKINFLFCTSLS